MRKIRESGKGKKLARGKIKEALQEILNKTKTEEMRKKLKNYKKLQKKAEIKEKNKRKKYIEQKN